MGSIAENRWVELYLANIELLDEGSLSALNRHRRAALESFNLLGVPTKGSGARDRYHYTDLYPCLNAEYEYYFIPSYVDSSIASKSNSDRIYPSDAYTIDLVNGFCHPDQGLTRLDNGIIYGSLSVASRELPELVEQYYHQLAKEDVNAVTDLTTAFVQDGPFVYVPAGVRAASPFIIDQRLLAQQESIANFGRGLFIFEPRSEASLFFSTQSDTTEKMLWVHSREFFVEDGAQVEWTDLFDLNLLSCAIASGYIRQGRDSLFRSQTLMIRGGLVRSEQTVMVEGPGAQSRVHGVMVAGNEEHFDLVTDLRHMAPDCSSDQQVRGMAAQSGAVLFTGRIYVAQDAQRIRAFQHNNSLLLSEGAKVRSKPQLEIYADDVKCSHGATVGQLDTEAIYYMRQRGISEASARRLQMYGFARKVVDQVSLSDLRALLDQRIVAKIDQL